MMDFRHIIFDFNGTLVNTNEIMWNILDELIKGSHFKSLAPKDFDDPRILPWPKKVTVLIFSLKYQRVFFERYSNSFSKINFADGVKPMLTMLNENNRSFSIISSNSSEMIKRFFALHNIPVKSVYQAHRLLGKKKAIKAFMKQNGCNARDIVYIGDEKRDVETCNKCGTDSIYVTWGYGGDEDVSGYNVKAVVKSPAELFEVLITEK